MERVPIREANPNRSPPLGQAPSARRFLVAVNSLVYLQGGSQAEIWRLEACWRESSRRVCRER